MAEERNIELSQCKTIKEMRDVIITELYGEDETEEEAGESNVDVTSEIDYSEMTVDQKLVFKRLQWEIEDKQEETDQGP